MPNIGRADLTVALCGERSVVVEQYGQAPLQVHKALYLDDCAFPTVYLRSPSSGLLDGDEHHISITVRSGARLVVCTQAETQVYPGRSRQCVSINLAENAHLTFVPHQLILTRGCNLRQTIDVQCSPTSSLLLSEGWCAGRIAMNERWQFEAFVNTVAIRQDGRLIYRENFVLRPADQPVTSLNVCADRTHFRSFYAVNYPLPSKPASGFEGWSSTRGGITVQKLMAQG